MPPPLASSKRLRLDDGSTLAGPASSSSDNPEKEQFDSFKLWLKKWGAAWNNAVSFARDPVLGIHVVATEAIPANAALFALPARFCISAAAARAHPVIGAALVEIVDDYIGRPSASSTTPACSTLSRIDADRVLVYAMLLYENSLGVESFWFPYFSLLPTLTEMSERAATCAPASRVASELQGTHLGDVVVPRFHDKLDAAWRYIISPLVNRLAGGAVAASPRRLEGWATHESLRWAAAVYWSRAVLVPLDGQRCEALTPLIDLMNHRPGTLSSMESEQRGSKVAAGRGNGGNGSEGGGQMEMCVEQPPAADAATEATVVYKYGRSLKQGEQITLNYGARGNEELFGYFGFTLPGNKADVLTINGISTGVAGIPPGWQLVLWHDALPAALLDQCRAVAEEEARTAAATSATTCTAVAKVVAEHAHAPILPEDVYNIPAELTGPDAWRTMLLLDCAVDFQAIGTVACKAVELQALGLARRALCCCRDRILAVGSGGAGGSSPNDAFASDAAEYRHGQVAVLDSVLARLKLLNDALQID